MIDIATINLLVNKSEDFKEFVKNVQNSIKLNELVNKDIYDKIINQLLTLNIFYALKIILSKNNLNDIKNLLLNVSNNISTSIAHIDPFIDRKEYREIQEICTNRSLTNISLLSCHSIYFNRKNNNISILMQKCSAGTYSAYVKDYKIAPCEFFTTNYVDLNTCKTIHDFWYHPFFKAARKTVIKQKSCNK